jgi:hypothetical protein
MRRVLPLLLLFGLSCTDRDGAGTSGRAAPPAPHAAIVIEPPQLRVGDVATVEVAVVTPPDHAVAPLRPPEAGALGPLWLLDVESLPVEPVEARWTHRIRLRVRAREVGSGTFPPLRLDVVGPEGARLALETEARPFEVVSVLPSFPERLAPFPFRLPEAAPATRFSPLAAAAAGAAAALAGVAAVALARRRRRAAARSAAEEEGLAAAPWTAALAALEAAALESEGDWRRSADRSARALRAYVAQRWGWPVDRRTIEELASETPPFALAARWPAALGWLRALDALRFRPDPPEGAAARVRQVAEEARRWVADTVPREPAR